MDRSSEVVREMAQEMAEAAAEMAAIMLTHQVLTHGVTEWACACSRKVWRPYHERETHLAQALAVAGFTRGDRDGQART